MMLARSLPYANYAPNELCLRTYKKLHDNRCFCEKMGFRHKKTSLRVYNDKSLYWRSNNHNDYPTIGKKTILFL